jgi:hypothetical protein
MEKLIPLAEKEKESLKNSKTTQNGDNSEKSMKKVLIKVIWK